MVHGENVNLLPYFNGCLASTNRGDSPQSVNFLDDGTHEQYFTPPSYPAPLNAD